MNTGGRDGDDESSELGQATRRGGTLAGLVVFALQFPWGGGVDTDPPTCYGMFYLWTVPCRGWPTVAAGAVTGLLVWVVLLVKENPKLT